MDNWNISKSHNA